jgi:hypothetical protein
MAGESNWPWFTGAYTFRSLWKLNFPELNTPYSI